MFYKPRNPFAALASKRKAGTHTKPVKSTRRKEKMKLMQGGEALR